MNIPLDFMHFHKSVFKLYGFFDIDSDSKLLKFLMKLHRLAYMIGVIDFGFILFTLSTLESSSVKDVLQIFFVVVAYSNALFKSIQFYMKQKQLQNLWTKLDHCDYVAIDHTEKGLLDISKNRIQNIVNVYSWFGTVNLIVAFLQPIMRWERTLARPMYTFGIDKTTVGFGFSFLFQCTCALYAGGINIAVNMFLFDVFISITYFLELLCTRISRLGYASGFNENYTEIPHIKRSFYQTFCQQIEMHLKIDGLVQETNALINDVVFFQVIQAVFVYANALVLLIAYDMTFVEFIVPSFWFATFLAEMSIYCFFGNNIIYAFERLHHGIYTSNFIAFDKETNQALLKMMLVTGGRKMSISGVGFVRFELSFQTLLQILKTTYSTVMLIRTTTCH